MGVPDAVHGHPLMQPEGQVPFTGSKQPIPLGPISTKQQSWPAEQHWVVQQTWPPPQVVPLHGGVPQVPLPQ
jgi:hypothetical protein